MNKIIFGTFVLIVLLLSTQAIYAVPAAPSPTCEVIAKVAEVNKDPTSDYYDVKLNIIQVRTVIDEGFQACEELYPVNSTKDTLLYQAEYQTNHVFPGQIVRANLHFDGDERFSGIFLSNVEIISTDNIPNTDALNYVYYLIIIILVIALLVFLFYKKKKR